MSTDKRDYLTVVTGGETFSLSVFISPALTLGISSRARELRRRVKSKIAKWSPGSRSSSPDALYAEWHRGDFAAFQNALAELEEVLSAFEKERLEPKAVQEALGITAQEYRRWLKDGRLPKSGTRQFKKGKHVFQYFTHRPSDIGALLQHPEEILRWRQSDLIESR